MRLNLVPLFWQHPCITEQSAALASSALSGVSAVDFAQRLIYVAFPWATLIDASSKQGLNAQQLAKVHAVLALLNARVIEFSSALPSQSTTCVITVCQHIYWERALPWFKSVGVTDLLLSHCPHSDQDVIHEGIRLYPWPLYAVNVENPHRTVGLEVGKINASKRYLASFIGAYADHYLSNHRQRLQSFSGHPDFFIRVGSTWHFEHQVYQQQLNGMHVEASEFNVGEVKTYNQVLSDSVFSLCPAGAGANTIRFWESLAVGAIPVVLGPRPSLPINLGPGLPGWEDAVLFLDDHQFGNLPGFLNSIPQAERDSRQQACLRLYAAVRQYTPFKAITG